MSIIRFKENCTQDQFEKIHQQLEQTRRTSSTVKVDRAALAALLLDHGQLHEICKTGL